MIKITQWFVIAIIVVVIAYDIVASIRGGTQATISNWFWVMNHKEPLVPFLGGALVCHLFFHDHN